MTGKVRSGDGPSDVPRDDWDLFSDAMFLAEHPGWTWQALRDTPAEVIDLIRKYDEAMASKRSS